MKRSVRVLRRAQRDIEEIQSYLAREAPRQLDRLIERLLTRIEGLSLHAASGARPRDARLRAQEYRFLVEGRYLIFYKATSRMVRVYRVVHASKDYFRILR